MGASCCPCLGDVAAQFTAMQHKEMLSTGAFFVKKSSSMGGLMKSEDRVRVCMSSDSKNLEWQIVNLAGTPKSGSRNKGFVEFKKMKSAEAVGATVLQVIGDKSKCLLELEVEAGDTATRDEWQAALAEIVKALAPELTREEEVKKEERRRADKAIELGKKKKELDKSKAAAEKKKAKYSGAGMKYTAEAMARKSLVPS